MKIDGKTALAMVLFVVAVFMLASKFMLPTSIQVIIEGQSTYVKEIPNVYTALDCVIIAIASFMLGISVFYLLFVGFRMPERERVEHEAEPGGAGSEPANQVEQVRNRRYRCRMLIYKFQKRAGQLLRMTEQGF